MRNHVTYETAVRLKEAGFPQPVPEEGQLWYNPKTERLCIILFNRAKWSFRVSYFGSASNKGGYLKDNFMFAPTAADILRELWFPFDGTTSQWFLNNPDSELEIWKSDDPSEAAAQAFLNLKAEQ